MKVAAPAMNQSIPYFDHRPSSTSGEFSAAEFVTDSNVYSTNSGTTYQVSNAPTQISSFSTALDIKPGTISSLSNNSTVTATLPSGLRVSTPSMLSIPSTVSQPATMQVVINQPSNLPNGSHIVITPQRDGDQPLYVQYVVPADNTGNAAINLGGNTITEGSGISMTQITDPLAGPSNSSPIPSATSAQKKSLRFTKKNREHDSEKESVKKAKQAEAARLRYHRLNAEEKKALNLKRTQAQKRKRQREKEMAELESILRETNDIIDDPQITEQLREKRIRARWAEAARSRYQRMSSEERRAHNVKRRMRQLTVKNEKGEVVQDHDAVKEKVREQNSRKALAARTRYHRMTADEKKFYNQRRTEAFRRRRLEEEALLAMPIGRINGEALDRAQQIVVRNAKRAEAARLRYQRMTPDERKVYNQKRYTPKRRRDSPNKKDQHPEINTIIKQEEDVLRNLERDVLRRTNAAQQVIRQRGLSTSTPTIVPPTITDATSRTLTLTLPHVLQPQGKPIITSASQALQFPQNGTIIVQAPPQPQIISTFNANEGSSRIMHARRPQSRRVPTSIGGTAIAYDAGSRNDPNMKYVRLVSANEQASTSYAMTTNFQPTQELFPNAQVITGTSPDGAIVEYVIDQRDFDPSGIPPTMYVEVMPNMHAPGQQEEEEPQLNEEEVLAIENGYLNAIDAPVKKSRYSRMSEADRERYNARRRQRRLEKKKKKMEEDALAKAVEESLIDGSQPIENIIGQQEVKVIVPKTEQIVTTKITPTPQFLPIADIKVPIEEEKTSRTETARNRYHAMTEDERKVYNQKRASAFRKRRKEEEILLSTPPECSSPGRISRAQEIVVRNAKRAEKARLRYQRMTLEERREYNHRRTVAKKARRLAKSQILREAAALGQNRRQPQQRSQQQPRRRQQQQQRTQQQPLKNPSQSSNSFNQQRTFENGLNTDIVNEEALSMLERDVVRRTQVAQMALMKQRREKQNRPFNTIDDTIEQVATYGAALPLNEPKDHTVVETVQDYIEPSTLPLVIVDQHGNPANLPEGSIIEVRQEHPNGPQTIIIHTAPPPPLNHRFIQPPQPSMVQFVTTSMAQNALPLPNYVQEEPLSDSLKPASNDSLNLPKSEILRARRAERARQRYHNMAAEERKQFNAKRAVSLRNARVRDEELCRLGEEARKAGNELNNDTMKAINAAQQRRLKRAESARLKYQRMSVDERRIYNQNRDNNRRAKKRDSEPFDNNEMKSETSKSEEIVVDDVTPDYSFE